MRKFFAIAAVGILCAAIASCSREAEGPESAIMEFDMFSASIEDEPATKLHLASATTFGWDIGDAIGVFSNTQAEPVRFEMGEDGCFHGEKSISGTEFVAYYPYGDLVKDNTRLVTEGWSVSPFDSWPGRNLPMLAKASGNHLQFKQVCGLIHLRIIGSGNWCLVAISGNNGEELSREAYLEYTSESPELCYSGSLFSNDTFFGAGFDAGNGFDLYFPIAPMTFEKGFTVTISDDIVRAKKQTTKKVVVERGKMLSYTLNTDDLTLEQEDGGVPAEEKEALIALYNAMDGANWNDNKNWCSDQPVCEWAGVSVEDGHVAGLSFYFNNLKGTLPEELTDLTELKALSLEEEPTAVSNLDVIYGLTNLETLRIGIGDTYSMDFQEYESWMVTLPAAIGNLKNLSYLEVSGVKGPLPAELFDLDKLSFIWLRWAWLNGPLPTGFGKLKNLETLWIQGRWRDAWDHQVSGTIPEDIYDCTNLKSFEILDTMVGGELSPKIGNLTKLENLRLSYNEFSGPIPAELSVITPDPNDNNPIDLRGNHFSGKIPASFSNWPAWNLYWGYIATENDLDMSDCMPYVPDFEVSTLTGEKYSSSSVKNNELTVYYQLATWCAFSPGIIPELKDLYSKYHSKGLEVVSWSYEDADILNPYVEEYGIPWICFSNESAGKSNTIGLQMWPTNSFPGFAVFDSNGQLVFYSIGTTSELTPLIENHFGAGLDYESSDYSADGSVHVLQTATEGAGIDVVLMGDAYSDRLIADGTYADVMNRAMEAFFAEEPYKSYRNCFNVNYVDVVSMNESYKGTTALSTWYGDGTRVGGDDSKVLEYAQLALNGRSLDDALILVMMNRDFYAGTCYMENLTEGDYGRGNAIAYMPVSSAGDVFGQVLRHEAGGHGFAKLADEYGYNANGSIPQSGVDGYRSMEGYGWWRNVDFTSDPAAVKWSAFITDNRFASENIGVYEGACTYVFGAFRPTDNSIMNDNTGGFNAPSRYAIWYRINKLAQGSEWSGGYEDFAAWDSAHRASAPAHRRVMRSPEKPLPHLAPPVIKKHR